MTKSAKPSAPESARWQHVERLTDAVNHLSDEIRVVRDLLSEIREDLGWITRNGVPGHRGEHTHIVRMARDPLAPDANEHLEVRCATLESNASTGFSPDAFDALVSEIAEAVTVVGQEQVNLLLTALDDARAKLLAAIKSSTVQPKRSKKTAIPESSSPPVPAASLTPPEPGRLF
jgi:hypothetical protein